ncbi:MAG: winged helix-turn-helix domain-containing protein [Cyclobacteriaceae bacterium]
MKNYFYINEFRIDPEINTITGNGKSYKMEPKIMQVLMCLVNAKGNVVSKESLFGTVWAETIVVEMVLTRAISELRRVFEDKPADPKFISTISKSGYRLIANVSSRAPENRRKKALKVAVPIVSIAALFIVVFGFLQSDPLPPISTTPFTSDKGWEYHPSLSKNGEWVAYVSSKINENYSDIYLKPTLTDSLIRLTNSDGFYLKPVWSPDGNLIAAFGNRKEEQGIHIFSTTERKILNVIPIRTQYIGLAWSPDGEVLSYVAFDSTTSRHSIFKYAVGNQISELQVTSAADSWGDSNPRYSPDGKSLAFIRTISEGNQDIYNLNLSSLKLEKLTQINRNIFGFDWEDEKTLMISSNMDGSDNLWKLQLSSKRIPASPEKVVRLPYGESIQNPSIKNGLLVGEKWVKDTDLIISKIDGSIVADSMKLTSSKWELHPDISTDGKLIAFSSNRSGHYEIWMSDLVGNSIVQLTKFESGFSGKPKWSPVGDQIIFESNTTGTNQIYIMNADGTDLKQLTNGEGDYINPSWSRDGSFIYCSSNVGGEWNIWAQSLKNDRLRKVNNSGGYYLQESFGLGRTFITKLHQNGIWEVKLDGTEELLVKDLSSMDWGSWTIGGEGIYYFNRAVESIFYYDFVTKRTIEKKNLTGNFPAGDPGFSISEEAGILICGRLRSYGGDLVAIRNF